MKATRLLNAQSIISGLLNEHLAQRAQDNYPPVDSDQKLAALTVASELIGREISRKLADAGAEAVVRQYNDGLITLQELCNKIVEIATTLK